MEKRSRRKKKIADNEFKRQELLKIKLEKKSPTKYLPRLKQQNYFNLCLEKIKINQTPQFLITQLVNEFSSYFICNHFIGTEPHIRLKNISLPPNTNDILQTNNIKKINNYDIVMCQVNYFDYFIDVILPQINKKIILITSQMQLPQIHRSCKTDLLLKNKKIVLWISQNPIYRNNKKYMPFPYGLPYGNLVNYSNHLINYQYNKYIKNNLLSNLHATVHPHLSKNHVRKLYPIFQSHKKQSYDDYINTIQKSKFLISVTGDREDTYRHYEAIGLECIPISNINLGYKQIFGDNMNYCDINCILNSIKNNNVSKEYRKPNRDIITLSYWKNIIYKEIQKIKKNK